MSDDAQRLRRWMYLWIVLGAAIVLVVVGFLIAIASDLEHIDDHLASASGSVSGIKSDTGPLPARIHEVNSALADVDRALKPIPTRADQINANLDDVSGTLVQVERPLTGTSAELRDVSARLRTTSTSLDGTESSLAGASNRLVGIRGLAARIRRRLVLVQARRSLGTNGIWRRVRHVNGGRFVRRRNRHGLKAVHGNARRILAALVQVNKHLESSCRVIPPLGSLTGPRPGLRLTGPRQSRQDSPPC